jgi:adenylate kinase
MAGIGIASQQLADLLGIALVMPAAGCWHTAGGFDDAGELASIQDKLAELPVDRGFMIQGFPRTLPQARALDIMLACRAKPVLAAVLRVPDYNALAEQLRDSRLCAACRGHVTAAVSSSDRCPHCGEPLLATYEQAIDVRVADIRRRTEQLRGYYRTQNKLVPIMAGDDDQRIAQRIRQLTAQRYHAAN